MAIIKQYHKDTDTTYVYESISYWDAEKGQSRSKRRVIGKLDPDTGEIIPTGKRGRTKKSDPDEPNQEELNSGIAEMEQLQTRNREMEIEISSLKDQINVLTRKTEQLQNALIKVQASINNIVDTIN